MKGLKFIFKYFAYTFGLVILVLVMSGIYAFTDKPIVFINEPHSKLPYELPDSANSISGYLPAAFGANTAFQFNCNENDAVKWANKNGFPLTSIKNPQRILTYKFFSNESEENIYKTINDGLYNQWKEEDRGRYIVYCRKDKILYYHSHTR